MTNTQVAVTAVLGLLGVLGASFLTAWVTRRNAKDSQHLTDQLNAGQLYVALTNDQRVEIIDLRGELEAHRDQLEALQKLLQLKAEKARIHTVWDQGMIAQVNKITGLHIPPPPPLD